MKKIISRVNKKMSVTLAASLISGSLFASSLLGLLRERLLVARFGVENGVLDAYWAAFSIPDTMYFFLVTGAMSVTLIPVVVERLVKGNKHSAWQVSSSILNVMALTTLVASLVIFVFADPLMYLVAPGFDEQKHDLAVGLMRIIAVNPFVFSISTVLGSLQQAMGRFFFFALAPILYSVGIIFGIVFLSPSMGVLGVAIGVGIGSIIQLVSSLIGMIGLGFDYSPTIHWRNRGFKQVVKLLIPRSIDQGIDSVNALVMRALASTVSGGITSYQYAFTLHNVPIILIGAAISTAAFPSISEKAQHASTEKFKEQIIDVLRVILWLALPAAITVYIMRGYLVRLLVGSGNQLIADILGWFVVAIVFWATYHALSRAFYAKQDTKTPLNVSIAAIGLNIVLAVVFYFSLGLIGLSISQSIIAALESLILVVILQKKYGNIFNADFFWGAMRMCLAALLTGLLTYLLVREVFPLREGDIGFFTLAPKFFGMMSIAGVFYLVISYALNLKEAKMLLRAIYKIIFKPLGLLQ